MERRHRSDCPPGGIERKRSADRYESGLLDPVFYRDRLNIFSFEPPERSSGCAVHHHRSLAGAPDADRLPLARPTAGGNPAAYLCRLFGNHGACAGRPCLLAPGRGLHSGGRDAAAQDPRGSQRAGRIRAQQPLLRSRHGQFPAAGGFLLRLALPCRPMAGAGVARALQILFRLPAELPTGAISRDRFLLHAEDCLTYHNESSTEFPDWVQPSWHHCLIGCMRCQSKCPENQAVWEWFDDRIEFSEQETACLVGGLPWDQLPLETATKLGSLGLNEDYQILCRNLSMLILARSGDG